MNVNVIFLGGAKRVSMARKFIDASRRLGINLTLRGYELNRSVALACVADDIIEGRKWSDPGILDHLASFFTAEGVNVLVPFVDGAVEIAARAAAQYDNVFAPTGNPVTARAMFDKIEADGIFRSLSLAVPERMPTPPARYPVIAKPRNGSASKGIVIIRDADDFARLTPDPDRFIIQEYISDREEFTVDCYRRVSDGKTLCVSPRRRLETAGGEVVSTLTADNAAVTALTRDTLERVDLRGAVTVQVLHDHATDRYMIMEVNPRLGGGAVASVCAGCDLPAMILSEAVGLPCGEAHPKSGILVQRYLSEVSFNINEQ